MAVTKQRKQEIVQQLTELFKNSKAVMTTAYSGTGVNQLNGLRSKMFDENVKLVVAKKTLIRIAAKEAGYEEIPNELLEGPIALAFSIDDEIAAAKLIKEAAKELEKLELKGGMMDGKFLSQAKAKELADIPSYEELIAKLIGSMKSPISGFHGVLHGTLRNFVGVLKAIEEQGGGAAEGIAESDSVEPDADKGEPAETKAEADSSESDKAEAPTEEPTEEKSEAAEAPADES